MFKQVSVTHDDIAGGVEVVADAHGRVNLIGEHTDYHEGFVLPTLLPQRTVAHVTRRRDSRVRAASDEFANGWREYELGGETPGRDWLDYVQGVTATLKQSGVQLPGI